MLQSRVQLPLPSELKALCQSLAVLDALLCPEFELRYHRFDNAWGKNEALGSLDNGAGDHVFIVFSGAGVFVKGFDHESEMSPYANDPEVVQPGVLDEVPKAFGHYLKEPALMMEDTTFCSWLLEGETLWQEGDKNTKRQDGMAWLLSHYLATPAQYAEWARDYFEVDISLTAVTAIFNLEPLETKLIQALNPEMALKALKKDLQEISYPIGKS
jgi:hypothetical protein